MGSPSDSKQIQGQSNMLHLTLNCNYIFMTGSRIAFMHWFPIVSQRNTGLLILLLIFGEFKIFVKVRFTEYFFIINIDCDRNPIDISTFLKMFYSVSFRLPCVCCLHLRKKNAFLDWTKSTSIGNIRNTKKHQEGRLTLFLNLYNFTTQKTPNKYIIILTSLYSYPSAPECTT